MGQRRRTPGFEARRPPRKKGDGKKGGGKKSPFGKPPVKPKE